MARKARTKTVAEDQGTLAEQVSRRRKETEAEDKLIDERVRKNLDEHGA